MILHVPWLAVALDSQPIVVAVKQTKQHLLLVITHLASTVCSVNMKKKSSKEFTQAEMQSYQLTS